MAGLLGDFGEFLKTPEGQGLLSGVMGYAANARRGTPINNLGRGGLAGIMGYSGALDRQAQAAEAEQMKKYRDMQMQQQQMQIEAAKKAEADKAKKAAIYAGRYTPEQTLGGFSPSPDFSFDMNNPAGTYTPVSKVPAKFDATGAAGDLFKAGFADDGFSVLDKFKPKDVKLKEVTPMKDPQSGKLVNVALYEDGTTKVLPYGVKPDVQILGLGDRQQVIDKNDVQPNQSFVMGQSPDSKASNALGWANYAVSRDRLSFDKSGGADANKPQLVDGQWVYRPTAENPQGKSVPVAGFQKQLGETAKKTLSGVESLNGAIGEYLKELEGWGAKDALSPDRRAAMGTKYNNMMLQAKEAYNLGVLNGPDYDILQSVVKDPTSLSGAFVSNKALANQAKELSRMMSQYTAPSVRDSGAKAEKTQANGAVMDTLPSPVQHKGKTIRDTSTGKLLTSNGIQWVEAN